MSAKRSDEPKKVERRTGGGGKGGADSGRRRAGTSNGRSPGSRPALRRLWDGFLVIAFGAMAALIVTPGLRQEPPPLTRANVGKPAPRDIKAARTFQYMPDSTFWERERQKAVEKAPVVYDFYSNRLHRVYEALLVALNRALDTKGLTVGPPAQQAASPRSADGRPASQSQSATHPDAGAKNPRRRDARPAKPAAAAKKGAAVKIDKEKAEAAFEARWKAFSDFLEKRIPGFDASGGSFTKEDFKQLYSFGLKSPGNAAVLEEGLRTVFWEVLFLDRDRKYVRSLEDLRWRRATSGKAAVTGRGAEPDEPLARQPRRILLRVFRERPDGTREMVRSRVVTELDKVSLLGDLLDRLRDKVSGYRRIRDRKVRAAFQKLVFLAAIPNLERNDEATEAQRQAALRRIQRRPMTFVKGQILVRAGQTVTEEHLRIVEAMERERSGTGPWQVAAGMMLFVLFFHVLLVRYLRRHVPRAQPARRDLLVGGLLLVGLMGLAEGLNLAASALGWWMPLVHAFMPVAAGASLVRLLMGGAAGLAFAAASSGFSAVALDAGALSVLYLAGSALVGAATVGHVQNRFALWKSGALVAGANLLMIVALRTFSGSLLHTGTLWAGAAGILGGLASGFLASALLPVLEWIGDYTTDVTLLEYSNQSNPLLLELLQKAPGTHHHSMVVGSLAEAAANAIGANGLLARVAAYYHDVGKMKNSQYFAENIRGDNPHDKLKPSMSALVVRSHVLDTRRILQEHKVPRAIQEVAASHHGTSLMEYFFEKAKQQAAEGEEVLEQDFRYPGPKPQTKEAGILMLADAVEAAARSEANATGGGLDEEQLRLVIDRVIKKKFADGQLAECDLSLKDITLIGRAFLNVLTGMYHQRPEYPGQREARRRSSADGDGLEAITTTRDLRIHARAKERAERAAKGEEAATRISSEPPAKLEEQRGEQAMGREEEQKQGPKGESE